MAISATPFEQQFRDFGEPCQAGRKARVFPLPHCAAKTGFRDLVQCIAGVVIGN
jgi:hypothetical protein